MKTKSLLFIFISIFFLLGCREPDYSNDVFVNITNEKLDDLNNIWQSVGDFQATKRPSKNCVSYKASLPKVMIPIGLIACIAQPEESYTGQLSYLVAAGLSSHDFADKNKIQFEDAKKDLDGVMEKVRQALENRLGRKVERRAYNYSQPF